MSARARYFIVLNGGSGRADAAPREAAIRAELDAAGVAYEMSVVDDPSRLSATAHEAVDRARGCDGIVVAAGGDGTINAVAQEVLGSGCRFGVLPQGTFNFFGRTHGIDADPAQATRALLAGSEAAAQVGRINGRVFLVNASLGLYPDLLEDREAAKQKFGRSRGIAMAAGLRSLLQSRHQLTLELEADGRTARRRTPTLVIGNNQLQLAKVGVTESPAVEAGALVAILVRPIGTLALLGLAVRGVLGRLGDAKNADTFVFRRLRIEVGRSRRPRRVKVAVDGEILWLDSPLLVDVAPEALRLIVPPESMRTDEADGGQAGDAAG
jgi:diacylglycerol kinase family enzyme